MLSKAICVFCLSLLTYVSGGGRSIAASIVPDVSKKIAWEQFDQTIYQGRLDCSVTLEGEIVEGDLSRLQSAVNTLVTSDSTENATQPVLCLNSPGGSYDEGLAISEFILEKGITTQVTQSSECYSACAIVFMAGTILGDGGPMPSRVMSLKALIGFHAPYLMPQSGTYTADDLREIFKAGITDVKKLIEIDKKYGGASGNYFFPEGLLIDTLSRGPDELFYIDNVGKVISNDITLLGSLELPHWKDVDRQMLCNLCDNVAYLASGPETCKAESMTRQVQNSSSGKSEVVGVDYTFLNYGSEEGGETCKISTGYIGSANGQRGPTYWNVDVERTHHALLPISLLYFFDPATPLSSFQ